MTHDDILAKLRERFGPDSFTTSEFRDNKRVVVPTERLHAMLECLKADCAQSALRHSSMA